MMCICGVLGRLGEYIIFLSILNIVFGRRAIPGDVLKRQMVKILSIVILYRPDLRRNSSFLIPAAKDPRFTYTFQFPTCYACLSIPTSQHFNICSATTAGSSTQTANVHPDSALRLWKSSGIPDWQLRGLLQLTSRRASVLNVLGSAM